MALTAAEAVPRPEIADMGGDIAGMGGVVAVRGGDIAGMGGVTAGMGGVVAVMGGVTAGMGGVIAALRSAVEDADPLIAGVLGHLVQAEASLARPRLTLATARAGGARDPDRLARAAASVELLHVASLYHDDVIDDATERRGTVAAHRRWGVATTIVAGDLLVARALSLAASCGRRTGAVLLAAYGALCRGQLLESVRVGGWQRSEEEYFESTAGKAGAMFEAAARIGAIAAGADGDLEEQLARFGLHLGIAYQVIDDLVDVRERVSGGDNTDIAHGVCSLPIILALRWAPGLSEQLRSAVPASSSTLLEMTTTPELLAATAKVASRYLGQAQVVLDRVSSSAPGYRALTEHVDQLHSRLREAIG